jgi:peptide chain release factor 1
MKNGLRYLTPLVRTRLARDLARYNDITRQLEVPTLAPEEMIRLRKEQAEAERLQGFTLKVEKLEAALKDLEAVQADASEDKEMKVRVFCGTRCRDSNAVVKELAAMERDELLDGLRDAEDEIVSLLLPSEESDDSSVREVVVEVRAGTGGSEAQLFAQDLVTMYERLSLLRGWKFRMMSVADAEGGGFREAVAMVSGDGVYSDLRFEGGVHRVQRVPVTDRTRVHTSTATVAVLPTPADDDKPIAIPPEELQIDTTRARGAGGQHVNTTDSAIRITHLPTGARSL